MSDPVQQSAASTRAFTTLAMIASPPATIATMIIIRRTDMWGGVTARAL